MLGEKGDPPYKVAMDSSSPRQPWYIQAFGPAYLLVYGRRNLSAARMEASFAARALELKQGDPVLDLCCGPGFHLEVLRERGIRALGVDLSPALLGEARPRGPVALGDMRRLPFRGPFQGVVTFFTTFGYFQEDRENRLVLREVSRLLAPGGGFFLDYLNPSKVRKDLVPRTEKTVQGVKVVETRWIENSPPRVRKRVEITPPGPGEARVYTESVRLFSPGEMEEFLEGEGLVPEKTYGDFQGGPFTEESPRMILVSRKRRPPDKENP